tara:strand:- start:200 stop:1090 length:891 start_codon:yes stop_codon:yes gene_type:complete
LTETHLLHNGNYEAVVHTTGAGLWALRFKDEDYIPACAETGPSDSFHGSIIAPWPNRIRDGRYSFDGKNHQLPINEIERNNALHGLSTAVSWKVVEKSEKMISLTTTVGGSQGYPATIELVATYRLNQDGLNLTFMAKNLSNQSAPFGFAFHPYVKIPGDKSPKLQVDASTVVLVDHQRLLPVQEVPVDGTAFDFRKQTGADLDFLDHAFSDFNWDLSGKAAATISGNGGRSLKLTWDRTLPWLQIHRPLRPELPGALVIEPMSCPPDAFNSGRDLVTLESHGKFQCTIDMAVSVE